MDLITSPAASTVLGCAIRVHKALGAGLFESVYENCLAHELTKAGIRFRRQAPLSLTYDGLQLPCVFRVDLVVADEVLVELKAIERVAPVHHAQMLTYLRCSGLTKGLLLNFNATKLGIKSFVMTHNKNTEVAEVAEVTEVTEDAERFGLVRPSD